MCVSILVADGKLALAIGDQVREGKLAPEPEHNPAQMWASGAQPGDFNRSGASQGVAHYLGGELRRNDRPMHDDANHFGVVHQAVSFHRERPRARAHLMGPKYQVAVGLTQVNTIKADEWD